MLFIPAGNQLRSKVPIADSTHAAQLRAYSGCSCRSTGSLCLLWCGHINKAHVAFLHRWSKIIVQPECCCMCLYSRCHHVNKIVIITIGDMCSLLLTSLLKRTRHHCEVGVGPTNSERFTPAPWLRWSPKQIQGILQSYCTGKGRRCPHRKSSASVAIPLSYSFIAVGAFWTPSLRHLLCR